MTNDLYLVHLTQPRARFLPGPMNGRVVRLDRVREIATIRPLLRSMFFTGFSVLEKGFGYGFLAPLSSPGAGAPDPHHAGGFCARTSSRGGHSVHDPLWSLPRLDRRPLCQASSGAGRGDHVLHGAGSADSQVDG